ncbi:MAG: hypothetical protein QOH43_4424 [Solirubrobacteraceae bacterium]|nr:hypothetical protein [Solirubrobacteraceae bacterium]
MPRVWIAATVVLEALLAVADVATGEHVILTSAYVVPVLALALVAGPRPVAALGAAAALLAVLSGVVNDDFLSSDHLARVGVVLLGVAAAVGLAQARTRLQREVRRLELLAQADDVVAGGGDLDRVAARLLDVLVPSVADHAVLDVREGEHARRVAVRLSGPDAARLEAVAMGRSGGEMRLIGSVRDGRPRILEVEGGLPEGAGGDADAELFGPLGLTGVIVCPLVLEEQVVGALALGRGGGRGGFSEADLRFAALVAARAALGLQNARLVGDLERRRRETEGVLEALPDAVHVHDATGQTVYANTAAARLVRRPDPESVVSARPGELADRFDITDPDGRQITIDEFPGRRLFQGDRDPPPVLARSVDRQTGDELWSLTRATAIRDPAAPDDAPPLLAVNVIEDVTQTHRAELAARLLAEAGEVLGASLDPDAGLERLARVVVPRLADWCGVDVPGPPPRHEVVDAAIVHADPDKLALGRELRRRYPVDPESPAGLPAVLRGAPTFVQQGIEDADLRAYAADDEHLALLRAVGFRHLVVAGIRVAGRTVGALTLVRGPGRPPFGPDEVELVEELTRRAGTALLNARLYQARIEVAETLQRSLLPPALPTVPGLAMAAHYRPAGAVNRVGGDFYDVHRLPDGWLVVMGDVTGKGAEAAALTGRARSAVEAVATLTGRPEVALAHLNALLVRRSELALCSVCMVHVLEGEHGPRARVLCGGHPQPLLLRAGEARPVGHHGPLLGAFDDGSWAAEDVALLPGDVLVLFTDGVTDAVGADGRLGEARLERVLAGVAAGDAADAVARVRVALDEHQVGPQRDDVAVLAVAVTGEEVDAGGGRAEPALPSVTRALELAGEPASVRQARRAVAEVADGRLTAARAAQVRLMVSELASNAVKHGGDAPFGLRIDLDPRRLRVEIADRGPGFTGRGLLASEADDPREGGYGLGIVERLAARWGVERGADGVPGRDGFSTRVWFEVERG